MIIYKTFATLALVTLLLAIPTPVNPAARPVGVSPVPTSKVLDMVAAAARITTLPKDLTPTLEDAARGGGRKHGGVWPPHPPNRDVRHIPLWCAASGTSACDGWQAGLIRLSAGLVLLQDIGGERVTECAVPGPAGSD